jgi:hypothetical protein
MEGQRRVFGRSKEEKRRIWKNENKIRKGSPYLNNKIG